MEMKSKKRMRGKRFIAFAMAMVMSISTGGATLSPQTVLADEMTKNDQVQVNNLTVNYQANPLGIEADAVRFGWQMDSKVIGKEQKSYHIIVRQGSPTGTIVWDSDVVESGLSTGISYSGRTLASENRFYWTVTITDEEDNEIVSEPAYFETGTNWNGVEWIRPTKADPQAGNTYQVANNTQTAALEALWGYAPTGTISNYRNLGGNPLLRTEVALRRSDIASAKLYMTALGNYEAYVNGEKALMADPMGNDVEPMLAPGATDIFSFTNYQTYDVTELVKAQSGKVVLAAEMSKGYYAGRVSSTNFTPSQGLQGVPESDNNSRTMALLAKMVITYRNGSTQVVGTDGGSWKSIAGPVVFNDYFNGEFYDANRAKQLSGWNNVGYNDSAWYAVEDDVTYAFETDAELRANNSAVARFAEEMTQTPKSGFIYKPTENKTLAEMQEADPSFTNTRGAVVSRTVDVSERIILQHGEILSVDLGQNIPGVLELIMRGSKDTIVKVRHAEVLNDKSASSDAAQGTLYYGAMRGADGQVSYYKLSDEARQTWRPYTTYNGFQYAEISVETEGESIIIEGIEGKVITSAHNRTGVIETSDSNVNQLISNSFWGQVGNWTTIPTDCNQRTERVGWTGDAQIFAQTAVYNFDAIPFYDNYMQITNENHKRYDAFGAIMPRGWQTRQHTALHSGWSDSGIVIPWTMYLQTGDKYVIERAYEEMDQYMDNVYGAGPTGNGTVANVLVNQSDRMTIERTNMYDSATYYGDWLAFKGAHLLYMNAVYQIYSTVLMRDMAKAIGDEAMVTKYEMRYATLKANFLRPAVVEEVTPYDRVGTQGHNPLGRVRTGGGFVYDAATAAAHGMEAGDLMSYGPVINSYIVAYQDNAQTALVWALKLGLYKDEAHREHLEAKLVENIKNEGRALRDEPENSLGVGFLGVNVILPVTSDAGASDVVYDMLMQDQVPGWMATVRNGATTNWERWDSYDTELGFGSAGMNSFNHFSYGCVSEWMYEYMLGIQQEESNPGFKEIILQPTVDTSGRITFADGSYLSGYGKIESKWTSEEKMLDTYSCVIPANTTATLYLPVAQEVQEFTDIAGVKFVGMEEHNGIQTAKFELASGGYDFSASADGVAVELKAGYTTGDIEIEEGWMQDGDQWKYQLADGEFVTNDWKNIDSKWYHFDEDAYMSTGWIKVGSEWYFLDETYGDMQTGWIYDGNEWYFLDETYGDMQTGWIYDGNTWYYMNMISGAMQVGWILDGSNWYYMDLSNGNMKTGWIHDGTNWYYMSDSGAMVADQWVDDYYLLNNGAMATNQWIGDYWVGADGRWDSSRRR